MYENGIHRDLLSAEVEYRLARARTELAGRRRTGISRMRRTRSTGAADPR